MKNYQKKIVFLILFELFLNIHPIQSQTSNDINTYNWFDTTVGRINLDINNGIPHTNSFRTLSTDIHLYLINKYESGKVTYENQTYYDVKLKYDIYRDILVLNPDGGSENIGINLIQNKVSSFSILDKNFIKREKRAKIYLNLQRVITRKAKLLQNWSCISNTIKICRKRFTKAVFTLPSKKTTPILLI